MAKRTQMRTSRSGAVVSDNEVFGPMAVYQGLLAQTEKWVSYSGEGAEEKRVADMAPAYATNALHKLRRWMDHLLLTATAEKYATEHSKLMTSPLVGALVEQALGDYYIGTYLKAPDQVTDAPHVDDLTAAGADRLVAVARLDGQLLEASIDGAVRLQSMSAGATTGQQARALYEVLSATISLPEAP